MEGFPSGQREQTVNLPSQTSVVRIHPHPPLYAGMAELADAHGSGPCAGDSMQVQVLFPAPNQYNPNQIFLIGDGFGLFVFFEKFEDTHFRNGVVKRPESKPRGPRKPKLAKDKEDNYENHQKL